MDASYVFRQGLGSVSSRPPQHPYIPPLFATPPPQQQQQHQQQPLHQSHQSSQRQRPDDADNESSPHRVAHTLTACCRCRQRKTRCDPALPRCLPCERAGATCEYYDTTKGKKINRSYVVALQEKVRRLEAELSQYTDEDGDLRGSHEAMGGMVRLNDTDETPRYLGPSSGISMTRVLMEEAKRYTDSKSIADLVPEVRARRLHQAARASTSKKSYPSFSTVPAEKLPTRQLLDGLLGVFKQRGQLFSQPLHEPTLVADVEAVFNGDTDPYKRFVANMMVAISLQKVEFGYAGLADSYYLAAMRHFEEVVQPKDLKTLQCLILLGQYSLLTPTRTAVYYVIGLAARICQQLGLCEESTIAMGTTDPQTIDLRRRLSWTVMANEFGLAHIMGRPNGFAKSDDLMDVKFFDTAEDENITPEGIKPGPVSEKKQIAIHFCKMRLLQAEIRRVLYDRKRAQPDCESHPWFAQMERKLNEWRESTPQQPEWCRPWFTGRYHTMIITMYRPSPQLPKPSSESAQRCFESAKHTLCLSHEQVKRAAVDLTWVFLLIIYMSLNALLWTLSYPEVRAKYPREQAKELVEVALDIMQQCFERWPGSSAAADLYVVFAKACMQSYDAKDESPVTPVQTNEFGTPRSFTGTSSPDSDSSTPGPSRQSQPQPAVVFNNASPFGSGFGVTDEAASHHAFDSPFQGHPTFRSNSIFHNPGTDANGRRGSYFPPEFTHTNDSALPGMVDDPRPPALSQRSFLPSPPTMGNALPTSPESLDPAAANLSSSSLSPGLSPSGLRTASPTPTPAMSHASPELPSLQASPLPPPNVEYDQAGFSSSQMKPPPLVPPHLRSPAFTIPTPPQPNAQQRGTPTMGAAWFNPPPPFISPHVFSGGMGAGYWGDDVTLPFAGLGFGGNGGYNIGGRDGALHGGGAMNDDSFGILTDPGFPAQYQYSQQRQGSLTQQQQLELMGVLETEGMNDIDSFLSGGDRRRSDVDMNGTTEHWFSANGQPGPGWR